MSHLGEPIKCLIQQFFETEEFFEAEDEGMNTWTCHKNGVAYIELNNEPLTCPYSWEYDHTGDYVYLRKMEPNETSNSQTD